MNTSPKSSSVPYISKTAYLYGLQCPKLLWSRYNAKHLFPPIDDSTQSVFEQALSVEAMAKRMFPTGIEIESPPNDFDGAVRLTQAALPQRRPIFQATATANGGYARVDILNP